MTGRAVPGGSGFAVDSQADGAGVAQLYVHRMPERRSGTGRPRFHN
jgi:hypothetical protein